MGQGVPANGIVFGGNATEVLNVKLANGVKLIHMDPARLEVGTDLKSTESTRLN
jgi:hypothetical protein